MSGNWRGTSRTQGSSEPVLFFSMWTKTGRWTWTLDHEALEGEAHIEEVEGGYKAVIDVTDTDFSMTFLSDEAFFESSDAAESFIRAKMDEAV